MIYLKIDIKIIWNQCKVASLSSNILIYCIKWYQINSNRGGSYIDSTDWIKTVALNHEEIKRDPQRIKKIKPFINKYNCKEINFSSEKNDWKKLEKNKVTIALNVFAC